MGGWVAFIVWVGEGGGSSRAPPRSVGSAGCPGVSGIEGGDHLQRDEMD